MCRGESNNFLKEIPVFAMATDPIYIGTGGYAIGRVDNTIIRDPITNVPKIPGSSLAGTWRYYVVLQVITRWKELTENLKDKKEEVKSKIENLVDNYDFINDEEKKRFKGNIDLDNIDISTPRSFMVNLIEQIGLKFNDEDNIETKNKKCQKQEELFKIILESFNNDQLDYIRFPGNRFLQITCAGQDNVPQEELDNSPFATNTEGKIGHCGHCIVCKGFGFSKKDISWQGMIFFSDLEIIFFPVFTIKGTKWITTSSRLKRFLPNENEPQQNKIKTKEGNEGHLNLGWLYLEVENSHSLPDKVLEIKNSLGEIFKLEPEDVVIVPEDLFSHIVNSNLEVRTSVSIDPITGAAKEGALFTSEAIPRGTIFYGNIRIFDKSNFQDIEPKLKPLPKVDCLKNALEDSKHFFETLGIGGMTTRGFGRLIISLDNNNTDGGS